MRRNVVCAWSLILVVLVAISCGQPTTPAPVPPTSPQPSPTVLVAVADTAVPTTLPTAESTAPAPTARPTRTAVANPTPRPTHPPTIPPTTIPTGRPEDKIVLQLRFEEGQSYDQQMLTEQVISQTVQGMNVVITQTIGFGYNYEVEDVATDGVATLRVSYTWVSYRQDSILGHVQYDSKHPPSEVPAQAQGFAAMVGEGFTIKVTRDGQIQEIVGVDEMIAHLLDKMNVAAGSTRAALEEQLRSQYGDEALKEGLEQAFDIFPDEPVGVGDSWTKRQSRTAGMPIVVVTTYTVVSRENGVSTLAVRSVVAPPPVLEPILVNGAEVTYELSGEQEGTLQVEESTGWTLGGEITQHLLGKLSMKDPSSGNPLSWPISIDSTIHYSTR